MDKYQAEKIVNQYGGALAVGTNDIARRKSLLPCSKIKIRLAFYIYLEELIRMSALDQKLGSSLVMSYAAINNFIEDKEAEEINNVSQKMKSGKGANVDESLREKWSKFAQSMIDMEVRDEINEFISECQRNK